MGLCLDKDRKSDSTDDDDEGGFLGLFGDKQDKIPEKLTNIFEDYEF